MKPIDGVWWLKWKLTACRWRNGPSPVNFHSLFSSLILINNCFPFGSILLVSVQSLHNCHFGAAHTWKFQKLVNVWAKKNAHQQIEKECLSHHCLSGNKYILDDWFITSTHALNECAYGLKCVTAAFCTAAAAPAISEKMQTLYFNGK